MNKIIRTKTRAEGGITPEEKTLLDGVAQEWISIAMRTDPIEPEKIIPAIEGLYAVAGLKKPRVVIVPSPLVMAFAYGAAAWIWHTRSAADSATDSATESATDSATRLATRLATESATYSATRSPTESATYLATVSATESATYSPTRLATRLATYSVTDSATVSATDSATDSATYSATRSATYSATRSATDSATDSATYSAIDSATRSATVSATVSATDSPTRLATRSATRSATESATVSATESATYLATVSATESATYSPTRLATRLATYSATDSATVSATDSATDSATYSAIDSATRSATRSATYSATESATRSATVSATVSATESATDSATDSAIDSGRDAEWAASKACLDVAGPDGLHCATRWYDNYQGGNMWAPWPAYIAGLRDVIGLELPEFAKYYWWEQAARHGGFRVLHPEFCMVSDFPEYIRMDDNHQPHCADGPSHRWRDGWELFHWHGQAVPRDWIMHPERMNARAVLAETNMEKRRAGCEIMGWLRVLDEVNAKKIDENESDLIGTLYCADLPDAPNSRILKYRCPTGRIFAQTVPEECESALAAQQWIWNDPDYQPEVEA